MGVPDRSILIFEVNKFTVNIQHTTLGSISEGVFLHQQHCILRISEYWSLLNVRFLQICKLMQCQSIKFSLPQGCSSSTFERFYQKYFIWIVHSSWNLVVVRSATRFRQFQNNKRMEGIETELHSGWLASENLLFQLEIALRREGLSCFSPCCAWAFTDYLINVVGFYLYLMFEWKPFWQ